MDTFIFHSDRYLGERDADRLNYLAGVAKSHTDRMAAFKQMGKPVPRGYLEQLDTVIEEMSAIEKKMSDAGVGAVEDFVRGQV